MLNFKSLKLCFAIALPLGLSACMDMQRSEQSNEQRYYDQVNAQSTQTTHKPKPVQKTYASKDPTQQATPGPARQAAPQIPVIQ